MLILIVFITCKLPHLYYPFYWDESWSYAPALQAMYQHGISLMPGSIDPEISRGHPLLFHALATAWMDIFGTSHFALHSFALFISVLLLIAVYEAGFTLFNRRVAVISLLLVVLQEVFFVQSSFLLPEIQVALFTFLSLCFYVKDKYLLTALCLTALFYTKESGLVLGVILMAEACVGMFNKKNEINIRIKRLGAVIFPWILIGLFFVFQKHRLGWYVFPGHTDLIDYKWDSFWYKFRMACITFAFYEHYKYCLYLMVLLLSIVAAIKNKNFRYIAVFLPATAIYYFVNDMHAGRLLPSVPFFIVFLLSVFFFLYVYRRFYRYSFQRRIIVLSGIFILCFLCFSTINFFTPRYLLCALIPLLFIVAVFLDMLVAHSFKWLYYPVLIAIAIISLCTYKDNSSNYGDIDMGAFDAMDVQQAEVDFFEKNVDKDKVISCISPLGRAHLIPIRLIN